MTIYNKNFKDKTFFRNSWGQELRQEIEGPQAGQLELSPVDRYSKIAAAREELSSTQKTDKKSHIPHSQSQGELPRPHMSKKIP